MKKKSVFSEILNKKYKAVEGGLSISIEDIRKSPFIIKKLENAKATLKKHPIPMDLFKEHKN